MTEAEWLSCHDPYRLFEFICDKASDRKLRLFAVACCRRVWDLLSDERSKKAVETAERFADGLATIEELQFARSCAADAWAFSRIAAAEACAHCAYANHDGFCPREVYNAARCAQRHHRLLDGENKRLAEASEKLAQVMLLRDVFGNPFRSGTRDPSNIRPAAVSLAQTIYDDGAFERMPELGNLLGGADCAGEDIVAHCRDPGPHVRGCWVVDLVLGKK